MTNKATGNKPNLAGCGFLWFIENINFHNTPTHLSSHMLLFDFLLWEVFTRDGVTVGQAQAERAEWAPPCRPRYKHLRRRTHSRLRLRKWVRGKKCLVWSPSPDPSLAVWWGVASSSDFYQCFTLTMRCWMIWQISHSYFANQRSLGFRCFVLSGSLPTHHVILIHLPLNQWRSKTLEKGGGKLQKAIAFRQSQQDFLEGSVFYSERPFGPLLVNSLMLKELLVLVLISIVIIPLVFFCGLSKQLRAAALSSHFPLSSLPLWV